jgi:hypothetical protein
MTEQVLLSKKEKGNKVGFQQQNIMTKDGKNMYNENLGNRADFRETFIFSQFET